MRACSPAEFIDQPVAASTTRRGSETCRFGLWSGRGRLASTIYRIEKRETDPTVEMLQRLLETLGLDLRLESASNYAGALVDTCKHSAGSRLASLAFPGSALLLKFRSDGV